MSTDRSGSVWDADKDQAGLDGVELFEINVLTARFCLCYK